MILNLAATSSKSNAFRVSVPHSGTGTVSVIIHNGDSREDHSKCWNQLLMKAWAKDMFGTLQLYTLMVSTKDAQTHDGVTQYFLSPIWGDYEL